MTGKRALKEANSNLQEIAKQVENEIKAKTGHDCQFVTVSYAVAPLGPGLHIVNGVVVEAYVLADYPHPLKTGTPFYAANADIRAAVKKAVGAISADILDVSSRTNPRGELFIIDCPTTAGGGDTPLVSVLG